MTSVTRRAAEAIGSVLLLLAAAGRAGAHDDVRVAEAAKRQDTGALRSLLRQKVDVNAPMADGATALLWAAQWDDLEMADLLIRGGARVNAANDFGVAPLTLAATNGSVAMIRRLLKAGANPNTALPTGETALMTAAVTGRVDAVTVLLDGGADVNATEATKGQTALMWAISEGNADVSRALVDRGADVKAPSRSGFTPLMFAARRGDLDTVRLLMAHGADVNEAAADGTTLLIVATVRGSVDLAKFLLDHGADPNADTAGYTAVHWVAGNWENATSISFGAEGGEWSLMGGIPRERKVELLEALVAHGANPNARITRPMPLGRLGPSAAAGVVVGGGQLTGATPFFLAALAGDVDVMTFLAANGADPLLAAKDGTTPLMAASGAGSASDLESTLPEGSHLAAARLAVVLGADVKAANNLGNTVLHIATHAGFDSVVAFLAGQGAEINAKNKTGETPLRIADGAIVMTMLYTHASTAKLLRDLGGTY